MTAPLTVGDPVMELCSYGSRRDWIGEMTEVTQVTATLIVCANGRKYNRTELWPLTSGRNSGRRLVSAHDPRVLVVRAQQHLAAVAQLATNLSRLARTDPVDVVADLASVQRQAHDAHRAVVRLMAAAERAE